MLNCNNISEYNGSVYSMRQLHVRCKTGIKEIL